MTDTINTLRSRLTAAATEKAPASTFAAWNADCEEFLTRLELRLAEASCAARLAGRNGPPAAHGWTRLFAPAMDDAPMQAEATLCQAREEVGTLLAGWGALLAVRGLIPLAAQALKKVVELNPLLAGEVRLLEVGRTPGSHRHAVLCSMKPLRTVGHWRTAYPRFVCALPESTGMLVSDSHNATLVGLDLCGALQPAPAHGASLPAQATRLPGGALLIPDYGDPAVILCKPGSDAPPLRLRLPPAPGKDQRPCFATALPDGRAWVLALDEATWQPSLLALHQDAGQPTLESLPQPQAPCCTAMAAISNGLLLGQEDGQGILLCDPGTGHCTPWYTAVQGQPVRGLCACGSFVFALAGGRLLKLTPEGVLLSCLSAASLTGLRGGHPACLDAVEHDGTIVVLVGDALGRCVHMLEA